MLSQWALVVIVASVVASFPSSVSSGVASCFANAKLTGFESVLTRGRSQSFRDDVSPTSVFSDLQLGSSRFHLVVFLGTAGF